VDSARRTIAVTTEMNQRRGLATFSITVMGTGSFSKYKKQPVPDKAVAEKLPVPFAPRTLKQKMLETNSRSEPCKANSYHSV
jgi:hypothetical protein